MAATGCAGLIADRAPVASPAQTLSAPGHVVVTVARGAPEARAAQAADLARRHDLRFVAGWPLAAIDRDCLVFAVDAADVDAALTRLRADPDVLAAQPMRSFRTAAAPVRQPNLEAINVGRAHRTATGAGVTVAVIDSAVATDHPDLDAERVARRDFVEDGAAGAGRSGERHGTAVAGVIGARGRLMGVAPDARLLALRACWEDGSPDGAATGNCNTVSLARALNAAALAGAQVVNLSLAGPDDPLLGELIDALAAGGAVVIAAAGAPGADFPASHPAALAVGVVPRASGADVVAPGEDVPSLAPAGGYDFFSGASIAAAHVSGAAALWMQARAPAEAAGATAALRAAAAQGLDACLLVAGPQGCDQ